MAASPIDLARVEAGFADPVRASQACFRALLEALARPATPSTVPLPGFAARMRTLDGLAPAAAALALTLCDHDTTVWRSSGLEGPAVEAFVRFHCGAPLVRSPGEALFAFVARPDELPPLAEFASGTDEYPDRSTTAIVQVADFATDRGWRLRGPGIRGEARLAVEGLGAAFAAAWQANRGRFPRGVDVVFVCGERIVGLPRSTRMEG
jgi:alpha-D-ribose 1-methylphosphonate 5-triphosphate synthase subunit PhnH